MPLTPRAYGMSDRPDGPAPMRRRGPRPLPLLLAASAHSGSVDQPAQDSGPDAELIHAIAAYRQHPYRRTLPDPPVIWAEGGSRMLDYGVGGGGPTVLVVPSLVNRAYVLDLAPRRSMLRYWAAAGLRPILLDWGWPGPTERQFSLTDYVAGRLDRALSALAEPVAVAGYCMGGMLALALALRRPQDFSALLLLATPWDFHAAGGPRSVAMSLPAGATLSVDAIQALFTLRDPAAIVAKYRAFAQLNPRSERARMFVALEDWLADGLPLAGLVATECLTGWYGANSPITGEWRIGGSVVDPAGLETPTLLALPAQDRIVPPESAAALARLIPDATVLRPAAGHVGMVAGRSAHLCLWQPCVDWLKALPSRR